MFHEAVTEGAFFYLNLIIVKKRTFFEDIYDSF